ncbi:MAG: hypothetical protein MZW92_05660 [Comamonadaceae bacterium]|nr:hypothetical protein [Comamonadaceae bacterium]
MFFGLNTQGSFDENGMQLAAFDARVSDGIVSGNGELDLVAPHQPRTAARTAVMSIWPSCSLRWAWKPSPTDR